MADITMCTQIYCHKADECYRMQAKPSAWQSMATFNCAVTEEGIFSCDGYYPVFDNTNSEHHDS